MLKKIFRLSIFIAVLSIPGSGMSQYLPGVSEHNLKDPVRYFQGIDERNIGLLDKGELSNMVTNYGLLADFHNGTPALHWPRSGTDVQHYGFGLSLILIADGTVISSIYDPSSATLDFDWEAADGNWFNPTRIPSNTAGDGVTPFMAFSDIRDTWPIDNGVPFWPGDYRENLENPGLFAAGEFVSDRDVFGVLSDDLGMGLTVEQTAYSYGRPYAEDFIFIRFKIINESGTDYNGAYAGFQADLKPDFYADDYIGYWNIDSQDTTGLNPSFFYKWDHNGVAQRSDSSHFEEMWEGPVGHIGLGMVETPDDLGVTSFHYFHDDNSPVDDEYFLAMMTNDTAAGLENLDWYFHGDNPAIDDPALWEEVDINDDLPGSEITFIIATGPFDLAAGDSTELAIVIALGDGEDDLREKTETAYFMAQERSYQGSGPPAVPKLTAVAGDGVVDLFWDNAAEYSTDVISGVMDFEGYRLYKSTDGGETWGDPITNYYGDETGWAPLIQYDVIDSITGLDPAYGIDFPNANKDLGDDSGIVHSYSDNSVTNGIETWYCITAYDRGVYDPGDLSITEPSYENAIGVTEYDANIAVAIPGAQAPDWEPGIGSALTEIGGRVADGTLELVIVDPVELLSHEYEITFNDSGDVLYIGPDTVDVEEFSLNLYDLTAGTFRFYNTLTGDSFYYQNITLTGDDLPIVNGFRLIVQNIENAGVRSLGWTTVNGDSSTFDWWTEDRLPGNSQSFPEVAEGLDDWRIIVTGDSLDFPVLAAGLYEEPGDTTFRVNLRVERADYSSGGQWVEATDYLWISDLCMYFGEIIALGPFGWDLTPEGAGYNPNPNTGSLWPDMLILRDDDNDSTGSTVWLKTQNGPAGTIPPSVGDVYTIETFKPFSGELVYQFSTSASTSQPENSDLSLIKVVPNPLIVASGLETNPYESKVMFTHLPSECEISIYTVSGNRVRTLYHQSDSGDGYVYWDVLNKHGQNVAYGVYIYIVKTPGGDTHTGKFMVIR